MTAAVETTATGPTVRSVLRSSRLPLVVGVVLVAVAALYAVLSATGAGGRLDPDSFSPSGSRAVAELLRDRGVEVDRATSVQQVLDEQSPATTVVLLPELLVEAELEQLAGLAARQVVVGATEVDVALLELPVEAGAPLQVDERRPACALPAAEVAGTASVGGGTYAPVDGVDAVGCYAGDGRAPLVVVPNRGLVLLGDGAPLTNDRLDDEGNAALALGLLSATDRVLWLVPDPDRPLPDGAAPSLPDLVADEVYAGAAWLAVVVVVLALWRARRLGRVVEEPLPVVVRSAEAVEGRGRLYRAAGARDRAAEALRAATRERVARRTGTSPSAGRTALVGTVADRAGADPAAVDALLYGGDPGDDDALVRLARDLRRLESSLSDPEARAR